MIAKHAVEGVVGWQPGFSDEVFIQDETAGILRVQTTCPQCNGAGQVINDPCSKCRMIDPIWLRDGSFLWLSDRSGWDEGVDRIGRKRDRLARLLAVTSILFSRGSGETGVSVDEIARLTGMNKRTVYRDIRALEDELDVPVFQAGRGRYGIERKFFLPPLRLSVPEAIVLFLAARLIARWSDQYDAAVVSAFTKLADALPPKAYR